MDLLKQLKEKEKELDKMRKLVGSASIAGAVNFGRLLIKQRDQLLEDIAKLKYEIERRNKEK